MLDEKSLKIIKDGQDLARFHRKVAEFDRKMNLQDDEGLLKKSQKYIKPFMGLDKCAKEARNLEPVLDTFNLLSKKQEPKESLLSRYKRESDNGLNGLQ
jgi:hypothetical protein